jgi:hypothetical protein
MGEIAFGKHAVRYLLLFYSLSYKSGEGREFNNDELLCIIR